MLWQGPVDKNDGKPCETWELATRSAITYSLVHYHTMNATPRHSIVFHHFKPWSHRPPCQAPGLCSFITNKIVPQVDFRHSFVDFQCFGKGLWTKTMANHVKPENLQGDLWHQHKAMSTITQLKCGSSDPERNFQNKHLLLVCVFSCAVHFCSFTSCRDPSLPSSLHSSTLSERSTGPTSEHLSNTTNVWRVSNTTDHHWYTLDSTFSTIPKPGGVWIFSA